MKCVLILMCVALYRCTLIQFQSGTIISQDSTLSAGSTTIHLIVKIEQLTNRTDYSYFRPCSYINLFHVDLAQASILNSTRVLDQFNALCKMFSKLKRLNTKLKDSFENKIAIAQATIRMLSDVDHDEVLPQSDASPREKRGVFSSLRYIFNIGSYKMQAKLQTVVQDLQEDQVTTQGELLGLKFVVAHESEKIKHLQRAAMEVTKILDDISKYSNNLADDYNARTVLQHYTNSMFFDLMTAGILTNELLQEVNSIVNDRVHAFSLLRKHYLPPTLISPMDLKILLDKMVAEITETHQFLTLKNDNIYEYYGMNNVYSYVEEDNLYVQIPVLLKMYHQEFQVFKLQPFPIPMLNQPDKLMQFAHKPFVAINKEEGTFFTMSKTWRQDLQCKGEYNVYCDNILTEYYMAGSKSCEVAIVSNETINMKQNCKIGLLDRTAVSPKIHRILDNKVLIVNQSC